MHYIQRIILPDGLISFPCPVGCIFVQVEALAQLQVFPVVNVFVVHRTDRYAHCASIFYDVLLKNESCPQRSPQQLHCPTDYGRSDDHQYITIGTRNRKKKKKKQLTNIRIRKYAGVLILRIVI